MPPTEAAEWIRGAAAALVSIVPGIGYDFARPTKTYAAAACGAPTWLIGVPAAWPLLGCTDRYPWYPQVKLFITPTLGAWEPVMADMAAELAGVVAAAER